jgi:hypothetical protein
MPVFVLPFYEKILADIIVKNPGLKEPALIQAQRGLECSFPSCGNLLESLHLGLEISDFGLKIQILSSKTI